MRNASTISSALAIAQPQPLAPPPAADRAPDESGVTLSEGGAVGFDESGYDGHEPPSDDVNQPVQDQRIFLPLTQR